MRILTVIVCPALLFTIGSCTENIPGALESADVGSDVAAKTEDTAVVQTLFHDDFEDGDAEGWDLMGEGWSIEDDNGNYVLSSSTGSFFAHGFVQHPGWYDFRFKSRIKFVSGNTYCELILRRDNQGQHYWVQVIDGSVALAKEGLGPFEWLARQETDFVHDTWYDFEVVAKHNKIKVYLDGAQKINVKDDDPWGNIGTIGFEVHDNSHVYFDDVWVIRKGG